MAKKLRLKDIAEQAGVSITVVSLLLNGRDVRVSDEKRRLILDIARQNHYKPNQIALLLNGRDVRVSDEKRRLT